MRKVKAKYVIPIVLSIILLSIHLFFSKESVDYQKPELVFQPRVSRDIQLIDVNKASLEDFMKGGLSLRVARELIDYRSFTGYIDSIDELVRVRGIGPRTVERMEERFYIDINSKRSKNKLNINNATEQELAWYGFNNREISSIIKFREKNKRVFSNIELMDIIGLARYNEVYQNISYNSN